MSAINTPGRALQTVYSARAMLHESSTTET